MNTVNSVSAPRLNLASISASDISTVKKASDRESIGGLVNRIWDKISDFFCGTDRVEAKKCLFDMYSPTTPDTQKIKSFFHLQSLAGPGYQDRFQHSIADGKETYALRLDGDERGEGVVLTRNMIAVDRHEVTKLLLADRQSENLENAFKRDITRGSYQIGDRLLTHGDAPSEEARIDMRTKSLEQALNAMQCTPEEKKAIQELANQSTFGIVMTSSPEGPDANGSKFMPQCATAVNQRLEYVVSREDGVIHLRALCTKDLANEQDEFQLAGLKDVMRGNDIYCKSLEIKIDIAIDASGKPTIQSLDYLVNKDLSAYQ